VNSDIYLLAMTRNVQKVSFIQTSTYLWNKRYN